MRLVVLRAICTNSPAQASTLERTATFGVGQGWRGAYSFGAYLSRMTIDHASLARRSRAHSFVACLSRMTIDHASLARRSKGEYKVTKPDYDHQNSAVVTKKPGMRAVLPEAAVIVKNSSIPPPPNLPSRHTLKLYGIMLFLLVVLEPILRKHPLGRDVTCCSPYSYSGDKMVQGKTPPILYSLGGKC